jgi:hypothetical protein
LTAIVDFSGIFEAFSGDLKEHSLLWIAILKFVLSQREKGCIETRKFLLEEVAMFDFYGISGSKGVIEAVGVITTSWNRTSSVLGVYQKVPELVAILDPSWETQSKATNSDLAMGLHTIWGIYTVEC